MYKSMIKSQGSNSDVGQFDPLHMLSELLS